MTVGHAPSAHENMGDCRTNRGQSITCVGVQGYEKKQTKMYLSLTMGGAQAKSYKLYLERAG